MPARLFVRRSHCVIPLLEPQLNNNTHDIVSLGSFFFITIEISIRGEFASHLAQWMARRESPTNSHLPKCLFNILTAL